MLDWLRQKWTDARRAVDFWTFERAKWLEHKAEAVALFSTEDQQCEIERLQEELRAEGECRFETPIANLMVAHADMIARRAEAHRRLELFSRDLNDELTQIYARLEETKAEIAEAFERRGEVIDDIRAASTDIRHWHDRAGSRLPLYGKRGKPIPQRSMFGMSQGDLEDAKSRKARAGYAISRIDRELASLKANKTALGHQIGDIKADREEKRRLWSTGDKPDILGRRIVALASEIERLLTEIREIREERALFIVQGQLAVAIETREAEIKEIIARRKKFECAFDTPEQRKARRAEHMATASAGMHAT